MLERAGLPTVAPRSALHERHLLRGARMETRDGWSVPAAYGDVEAEITAARDAVAVGERCGGWVVDVVGPGLDGTAAAWGVEALTVGAACPLGEGNPSWLPLQRWCRLTRDHGRVLGQPGSELAPVERESGVTITDLSSGFTTLLIVGPASVDLLARLVRIDLDPRVFADRRLALTGAAGVPIQLLRWDRGGLLAWELLVGRDVAEYFVETLEHAGDGLGLRWMGTEAEGRVNGDG